MYYTEVYRYKKQLFTTKSSISKCLHIYSKDHEANTKQSIFFSVLGGVDVGYKMRNADKDLTDSIDLIKGLFSLLNHVIQITFYYNVRPVGIKQLKLDKADGILLLL